MFFGEKLKELRLKYAKKGMRSFSMEMGMKPSEYSAIERGFTPPPKEEEWLHQVTEALELPEFSGDEMALYICWNKPFVMQLMDEDIVICHALMTDDTSADAKKLGEVTEYMQNIAKEHNKKARKYNESG